MSLKKSFAWSLAFNLTLAIVGVIRSKYLAIAFGPEAIGLVSQAFQLQLMATTFCSLSFTYGIVKTSAEANTEPERERILQTSLSSQILLSAIFVVTGLMFLGPLSELSFADTAHAQDVMLILLGVPFVTLANTQLHAVYLYSNGFDRLNKSSIFANIIYLILFFLLCQLYGVTGAIASISALALIQFCTHCFFVRKLMPLRKIFRFSWDAEVFKKIFSIASITLASVGLTYTANFMIRRLIIDEYGLHANGIFQVPVSLSMYYLPLVLWVLWGRIFPEVSKFREKIAPQFKMFLLVSIWGFAAMALVISSLKKHLVLILLSSDFLESLPLIDLYLLGDFFYLVCLSVGIYIFAFSKLRAFVLGHVIFFGTYLTLTYLYLPNNNLDVIPKCFIAAGLLTTIITLIYVYFKQKELIDYKILLSVISAAALISQL